MAPFSSNPWFFGALRPYFCRLNLLIFLLSATRGIAADATWKATPVTNNWAFDQNWTPESRPYSVFETATLDFSNVTGLVTSGIIGTVVFTPAASAYTFTIVSNGGFGVGNLGLLNSSGLLQKFDLQTSSTTRPHIVFFGSATAGMFTEFRIRGSVSSLTGATIFFEDNSTAGSANFIIEGGSAVVAPGGSIQFTNSTNAGQATFTTRGGEVTQGGYGAIYFYETSSAADATFYTLSGSSSLGGNVFFWDSSSAGAAHIFNRYGPTNEETPGRTSFNFSASAGTSTITNDGGRPGSGFTKSTITSFAGDATAAQSSITNRAALAPFGLGGETSFSGNAHAGSATIANEGAALANARGGRTSFYASSGSTVNAESAMIANHGASAPDAGSGSTVFEGGNAAQATIINESGSNGGVGGTTEFLYSSGPVATGGSATIINRAPTAPTLGGVTTFRSGTAGTAKIRAEGSSVAGDSAVIFIGANAGQSTITLLGATGTAGKGGRVQFEGNGTADQATLIARSGAVPNAPGGRILFLGQAQGGTARADLEAGALMDISSLTASAMDIGSIVGGGGVFLGAKNLRVGSDDGNALFAGVLQDGGLVTAAGGSLTKIGSGTFTLSGANIYTGATTVSSGTLCVAGSVAGDVTVNPGASLCLSGGSLGSPGSNITVAANGSLTGFGLINGTFTNDGLVDAQGSGTLFFSGAVTNNGVIRIRGGAVLDSGAATSFTNNGTLDLISGFASLPPNFANGASGVVLDSSLVRVKDVTRSGAQLTVLIDGYSGHSYQLQHSDSLVPSSFQDTSVAQAGETGQTLSFNTTLEGEARFYRVRVD